MDEGNKADEDEEKEEDEVDEEDEEDECLIASRDPSYRSHGQSPDDIRVTKLPIGETSGMPWCALELSGFVTCATTGEVSLDLQPRIQHGCDPSTVRLVPGHLG